MGRCADAPDVHTHSLIENPRPPDVKLVDLRALRGRGGRLRQGVGDEEQGWGTQIVLGPHYVPKTPIALSIGALLLRTQEERH